MKTLLASLALTAACGLSAQPLLVHYEFNNPNTATTTATDSSSHNRHGAITNWNGASQAPAALQTAVGVSGRAGDYAFDNTGAAGMGTGVGFSNRGGQVRWVGNGAGETLGNLTSLTISYWFKTPESVVAGGGARAVTLRNSTGDGTAFIENRFSGSGVGESVVTGDSQRKTAEGTYDQTNTWTFVAITFDGSLGSNDRIKFYVGGLDTPVSLVGTYSSGQTSISLGAAVNALTLGGLHTGSGQAPFQAIMDDFRLYGSTSDAFGALSLAELEIVRASAIPEPGTYAALAGAAIFACAAARRPAHD